MAVPAKLETLNRWENWIRSRWEDNRSNKSYHLGPDGELAVIGLGVGGEAGEIQEYVKKHIRDGKVLTNNDNFLWELGDELHYLTRLGQVFGYSLEQIMEANIDKLTRRDNGEKVG